MNYTTLKSTLAVYLVVPATNANFLVALPQIIKNAEERIYRDCDFLSTRTTQTATLVSGTRTVTVPTFTDNGQTCSFKVVQSVNLITPSSTAPDSGTRTPLRLGSPDMIDFIWGTSGTTGTPEWYAMQTDQTIVVAPTPNAAFQLEIKGTFRPASMGANGGAPANTYIGDNYEDLFFNACMVEGAGYQKNFGSQADDPSMSVSWERKYQASLASALAEAYRQKGQGDAWTPFSPPPQAQPARS